VSVFAPGRVVALRNVWEGRIVSARPATVVRDDPDSLMLYVPVDVAWVGPVASDGAPMRLPIGDWTLEERRWDGTHILSFARPGEPNAVLLFWDQTWRPLRWYVNLQSPLRRTVVGFDYTDFVLDAILPPDRSSWEWKDETELTEAIRLGAIAPGEEARLRDEGERTVHRIMRREPPFDRDWWDWRPDPSWAEPELPVGWDATA
jgi:hypothetical protein